MGFRRGPQIQQVKEIQATVDHVTDAAQDLSDYMGRAFQKLDKNIEELARQKAWLLAENDRLKARHKEDDEAIVRLDKEVRDRDDEIDMLTNEIDELKAEEKS